MVSAPRHISNRKYSIKQFANFSALFVINSHTFPSIKIINFEIQWNKYNNRNHFFFERGRVALKIVFNTLLNLEVKIHLLMSSTHKKQMKIIFWPSNLKFWSLKYTKLSKKCDFFFSFWVTYFCLISKPRCFK